MMPLQIGKDTGRNCFPKYYHEVLKSCGKSNKEIAKLCNISFRRLTDLMYCKNTSMDPKEFKVIKAFVKKMEQEKVSSGECVQNWPLSPDIQNKKTTHKFPKQVIRMIRAFINKGENSKQITDRLNSSKFCLNKGLFYSSATISTKIGNMRRGQIATASNYRYN